MPADPPAETRGIGQTEGIMADVPDQPSPQAALRTLADASASDQAVRSALSMLAVTPVLVPVIDRRDLQPPNAGPWSFVLPVFRHAEDLCAVPVFTCEERLGAALPNVLAYRLVPLGRLAAMWPAPELYLVIDLGHPDAFVLPDEVVRTVLAQP